MKSILSIGLALALSGCASTPTPEEIEAKFQQDVANAMSWCGQFFDTDEDLENCTFARFAQVEEQERQQKAQEAAQAAYMGQAIGYGVRDYARTMQMQQRAIYGR